MPQGWVILLLPAKWHKTESKTMITKHDGHLDHRITNRWSGPWCDTCVAPIEHAPEWCEECWGDGVKYRWSNQYHGRGKPYRCGKCKGTGTHAPSVCVDCGDPATIYSSKHHRLTSFVCASCFAKAEAQ